MHPILYMLFLTKHILTTEHIGHTTQRIHFKIPRNNLQHRVFCNTQNCITPSLSKPINITHNCPQCTDLPHNADNLSTGSRFAPQCRLVPYHMDGPISHKYHLHCIESYDKEDTPHNACTGHITYIH